MAGPRDVAGKSQPRRERPSIVRKLTSLRSIAISSPYTTLWSDVTYGVVSHRIVTSRSPRPLRISVIYTCKSDLLLVRDDRLRFRSSSIKGQGRRPDAAWRGVITAANHSSACCSTTPPCPPLVRFHRLSIIPPLIVLAMTPQHVTNSSHDEVIDADLHE